MAQNRNPLNTYRVANAETTDQGRLIIICYDVAINNLEQAKEYLSQNSIIHKAHKIYKAQDAISELMCSLNFDQGGKIAKNLYMLYEYLNWRLSEANIKKSPQMVEEVLKHLRSLREAWLIAIENTRKGEAGAQAPDQPKSKPMEKPDGDQSLSLLG
jgi:flagellar protein FliS